MKTYYYGHRSIRIGRFSTRVADIYFTDIWPFYRRRPINMKSNQGESCFIYLENDTRWQHSFY